MQLLLNKPDASILWGWVALVKLPKLERSKGSRKTKRFRGKRGWRKDFNDFSSRRFIVGSQCFHFVFALSGALCAPSGVCFFPEPGKAPANSDKRTKKYQEGPLSIHTHAPHSGMSVPSSVWREMKVLKGQVVYPRSLGRKIYLRAHVLRPAPAPRKKWHRPNQVRQSPFFSRLRPLWLWCLKATYFAACPCWLFFGPHRRMVASSLNSLLSLTGTSFNGFVLRPLKKGWP